MSSSWIQAARDCSRLGRPAAAVTLVGIRGSSPREIGATVLVEPERLTGSVGGGVLEHLAIQRARRLLDSDGAFEPQLFCFPLGGDSQQCCGGVVVLFFAPINRDDRELLERLCRAPRGSIRYLSYDLSSGTRQLAIDDPLAAKAPAAVSRWWRASDRADAALVIDGEDRFLCQREVDAPMRLALYGAGHVGQALVRALALQDCRIDWFDSRPGQFPEVLPPQVQAHQVDSPAATVSSLAADTHVLVLTHRHPLDYAITRAALAREDLGQVGLIGSMTKRRRFVRGFIADGLEPARAEQLICPIGVPGIGGKQPPVIAAAVVAQLLQWHEAQIAGGRADDHRTPRRRGLSEADVEASGIAAY